MFERFTERARQVVVLAQDESRALRHNYIGTEHILLGLVREGSGVAARILPEFGADAAKIRNEVMRMLSGPRRGQGVVQRPEPLSPEEEAELEGVTREKEEAIDVQDLPRAARLRAGALGLRARPGGWARYGHRPVVPPSRLPIVAIVLAAAGFPLGLLVGWLIWG